MISIIVAVAKNRVIGNDNQLLWDIKEDMRYFREKTKGKVVVMGRKTYESIGHPLPNRTNIVLTRGKCNIPGYIVMNSIEEVLGIKRDIFIIGGSEIYSLFIPYVEKMYITEIDKVYEGDTLFPEYNKEEWVKVNQRQFERGEVYEYSFSFNEYIRK